MGITGAQTANDQTTLPDLFILNFTVNPLEVVGEAHDVQVSAEIWNAGNRTYSGKPADIDVTFFVVLRLNGEVVGNASVPGLKFNSFHPYNFDLGSVRAGLLKCGANVFELSVDDSNAVTEEDELNNRGSITVRRVCVTNRIANTTVQITPGWNIIGANTLMALLSTTCDKGKISKTVYSYDPTINDYRLPQLDENLKPHQDLEITKAVWLYNYGDTCQMTSNLYLPDYPSFSIPDGWNMVAVRQDWQRKKLSEVLDKCNFNVGWFYDSATGWELINLDTVFAQEAVGKGFWIFTNEPGCTFKALT